LAKDVDQLLGRVGALIETSTYFVESVANSFPTRKPFGIAASGRT
jgi:hypothetical protein